MKHIITGFLAVSLLASPAFAAESQSFAQDRALAEKSLDKADQQRCIAAFSSRVAQNITVKPEGRFRFNDYLSRNVYDTLYWRESERGVAFTVPVRVNDPVRGEIMATLGCFYAVTTDGLKFQQAQQIAWKL